MQLCKDVVKTEEMHGGQTVIDDARKMPTGKWGGNVKRERVLDTLRRRLLNGYSAVPSLALDVLREKVSRTACAQEACIPISAS